MIKAVATIAKDDQTFAEFNKVHLDNPEYAIMINVVKTVAMMAVVKDFKLLCRYNINMLTKSYSAPLAKPVATDNENVVGEDTSIDSPPK